MPEASRGLLDTSVVIDLDEVDDDALPAEAAICAVTVAELAAGPHATDDLDERARRQDRLVRIRATMASLPFGDVAALSYGRVYAATRAADRKPLGARAMDLQIAAVALANDLPLYTRNPSDVEHLTSIGLDVRPC